MRGVLLSGIYYASLSLMHYIYWCAYVMPVCRALHLFTCVHDCSESMLNLLQAQYAYAFMCDFTLGFACLLDGS